MFVVVVEVEVHADRLEEFLTEIGIQAEASVKREAGCLRFEVLESRERPDRFLFIETYSDERAFRVDHRGTEHFARWSTVAGRVLVGDRVIHEYTLLRLGSEHGAAG